MFFEGFTLEHREANGQRVRFPLNLGNIVMDLNGVERTNLASLGGADTRRTLSLIHTASSAFTTTALPSATVSVQGDWI